LNGAIVALSRSGTSQGHGCCSIVVVVNVAVVVVVVVNVAVVVAAVKQNAAGISPLQSVQTHSKALEEELKYCNL
jgi:hypothetical protein